MKFLFEGAGFQRLAQLSHSDIRFEGTTSDIDDIFVVENVIVLVEYTTIALEDVSGHLKKKYVLYQKIVAAPDKFVLWVLEKLKQSGGQYKHSGLYHSSQFVVRVVYCSKNGVKEATKAELPSLVYMDYHVVKYFGLVVGAIRRSTMFELLSFLSVPFDSYAAAAINPSSAATLTYDGAALPEAHSSLEAGFKILSFYIDPESLLKRAYVLRRDNWHTGSSNYQRLISPKKIKSIRTYLLREKKVFVNNLIVSLPGTTKCMSEGSLLSPAEIKKTTPVQIQLPDEFNSIGIIDGQHRLFAYHEGGPNDEQMEVMRKQQNLLVTGIMYPSGLAVSEKVKFEARQFLQINSNQTSAKADIKQEIGIILSPFIAESIARRVVNRMNESGPLRQCFETHFYEKKKLKVTSIVSYAVRQLVNTSTEQGFYSIWNQTQKHKIKNEADEKLLAEYVEYCASNLNVFLNGVKAVLPPERWTFDKSVKNRVLTTVAINAFIICLRLVIENDKKVYGFAYYKERLDPLPSMSFKAFTSSRYRAMGQAIFDKCFKRH